MEKFRGALIVFHLLSVQAFFAQEQLCVLKTDKGILYLGNPPRELSKGSLINNKDVVSLPNGAMISFIDNDGVLYKLDKPGKYSYTQLKTYKVKKDQSSLTEKYLKYLWEEMTHTAGSGTVVGGVFRGENLMVLPSDSAFVVDSKVRFTWKTNSINNVHYFFLRNRQTQELLKLSTNGSELTLFKENPIFSEGNSFEWYIDTEAFPNLDNKTFNTFTTIDRTAYETKKETYSEFIEDMLDSGLTDVEINQILCETYGLCK